jgi:hypothetical protein
VLVPGSGSALEAAVRLLRLDATHHGRDTYYDDPLLKSAERCRGNVEWQAIHKLLPMRLVEPLIWALVVVQLELRLQRKVIRQMRSSPIPAHSLVLRQSVNSQEMPWPT